MTRLSQTKRARRWAGATTLTLVVVSASACEGILDVDLPGDIAQDALTDPGLAATLALSAQADFECGFSNYILSFAHWGDELIDASTWGAPGTWQTRRGEVDGGGGTCATQIFRGGGTFGPYMQLQIGRTQGKNAYEIISGHTTLSNKELLLAKAALYQGYSTMLLSGYCKVKLDPDAEPVTQAAGVQAADANFATAMQHATAAGSAGTAVLNAARVGRARALTWLGKAKDAEALAAAVPAGFRYNATHAAVPVRRTNWVMAYNHQNLMVSVDPRYRDLKLGGVTDTRVPTEDKPTVSPNDGFTRIWWQLLYTTLGAPIPLATWNEAQLTIAEAKLDNNDAAGAVNAINAIRTAYNLPLYAADPGGDITVANVRNQLKEERRRTLYLQSHRVMDMQRLNIPLNSKGRAYTATEPCVPFPNADL